MTAGKCFGFKSMGANMDHGNYNLVTAYKSSHLLGHFANIVGLKWRKLFKKSRFSCILPVSLKHVPGLKERRHLSLHFTLQCLEPTWLRWVSDACALTSTCGHNPSYQHLIISFPPFILCQAALLDYKRAVQRNISLNSGRAQPWKWKIKYRKTKLRNRVWKQHFTDKALEGDRCTQVHTTSQ